MVITDKSLVITFAIPVFFLLILIEYIYGKYVGKNTMGPTQELSS